jgi:hypothetical protein
MPQSAMCTYSAIEAGGLFNYELALSNTSTGMFDIYSFMFGVEYGKPPETFPLRDVVVISSPAGWTSLISWAGIVWGTNYQGSSTASGYVQPGQTVVFRFQSSTPPPEQMVFGCCYNDNAGAWGFCTNGTAKYDLTSKEPPYYAVINPLVLVIGDYLFTRINLPRPPIERAALLSRIAPGIQAMTSRQRDVAIRALDGDIAALTEVRAALKENAGR